MHEIELLPQLFKTEYRKIISVLCNYFGLHHIEVAEDITNDTFLLAAETWGLKSIPQNPTAWLYTVAKNKTKDYLKRNKIFEEKIRTALKEDNTDCEMPELDLSNTNIIDSQLRMIFVVCSPIIPGEAQIGLALRLLCGFGVDEIAEAFLTNKETINKRLQRAKDKLRASDFKIDFSHENELHIRLNSVLTTIYLLFNEGYYSKTKNQLLQKELCVEAMRLNMLLIENTVTNKPNVNALMSLMCFHSSRFEARSNEDGDYVLYDEQDNSLWNRELTDKGNYYLIKSAEGKDVSKYHLEASIAYWHSTSLANEKKWENILQLYNQLLQIEYSPMAALNRTYALFKVQGKEKAIEEAEKLQLNENHLYYTLLGVLYTNYKNAKAQYCFELALKLAKTKKDTDVIQKYLKNLEKMK